MKLFRIMAQTSIQAGGSLLAEASESLVPIETQSVEDVLWICRTDLLRCFDSETRGNWRLVCKQACKAVEDSTRCLTWKQLDSAKDYDTTQTILQKCPALEKICGIYPKAYHHLAGLPTSLRTLEIQRQTGPRVLRRPLKQWHLHLLARERHAQWRQLARADLSPLTTLTQLEEAVLPGLPASSIAALSFAAVLHSLDITGSPNLKDISGVTHLAGLRTLCLSGCGQLQDITALSAFCELHTLSLSSCEKLQDITALSACPSLHTLDLSDCQSLWDTGISALSACPNLHTLSLNRWWGLRDITALSACCNLHTLHLNGCEKLLDIRALSACPNLHYLDLRGIKKVWGITALPECCEVHI